MASAFNLDALNEALPDVQQDLGKTRIKRLDGGDFVCEMPVPQQFHEWITAHDHLQNQSATVEFQGGVVNIRSTTREPVRKMRNAIANRVRRKMPRINARAPPPSCHFSPKKRTHTICVRLNREVDAGCAAFKNTILEEFGLEARILPEVFRHAQSAVRHVSTAVVSLPRDVELAELEQLVRRVVDDKIKPLLKRSSLQRPYRLHVQGLEVMMKPDENDVARVNARYCNVLFANVHLMDKGVNLLETICGIMSAAIAEKGWECGLIAASDVKPKVTLMNTKHLRNRLGLQDKRKFWNFDARGIMQEYGDFDFGHSTFDTIEIGNVEGEREEGTGFYTTIKIPLEI